jgi:hypothetical protein
VKHKNEWFSRHARRKLQEKHDANEDPRNRILALMKLQDTFTTSKEIPVKLKALWALHVIQGYGSGFMEKQLFHENEHIRAWAVTLLCEKKTLSETTLKKLAELATNGDSQLVRLHLASALQRIPPSKRWELGQALISRTEDENDQNLPLMYWYGIEPLINEDQIQFLSLAAKTKIPLLRQFITRRATEK